MKADTILATIGETPHLRINRLFDPRVEVWAKLERANPGGSIKDRIALSMIEDAEARGILGPGSVVVEPTSGNTGIGLAIVCAVKGYRLILTMPESMSIERRKLMTGYGAELELTPRELGMNGSIARAKELAAEIPGAWIPMQFENPANVEAHRRTTAAEILRDFPEGLDYIVTGVGTGGHITGVAEVLKPLWPTLRVFAVEPTLSPVLSGGTARPASDPGDRRRVHPGRDADRPPRRDPPGRPGGRDGVRAPGGTRGGTPRRGVVRGVAGGRGAAPPAGRRRGADPDLRVRHRRALPLGRRALGLTGRERHPARHPVASPAARVGMRTPRKAGRLALAIGALVLGIGSCQLPQPQLPKLSVGAAEAGRPAGAMTGLAPAPGRAT